MTLRRQKAYTFQFYVQVALKSIRTLILVPVLRGGGYVGVCRGGAGNTQISLRTICRVDTICSQNFG